jgi:hypothetical protein
LDEKLFFCIHEFLIEIDERDLKILSHKRRFTIIQEFLTSKLI